MTKLCILLLCFMLSGCGEPLSEKQQTERWKEESKEYFFLKLYSLKNISYSGDIIKVTGINDKNLEEETWVFTVDYKQRDYDGIGDVSIYKDIFYNGESKQLFVFLDLEKEFERKKNDALSLGCGYVTLSPPAAYKIKTYQKEQL